MFPRTLWFTGLPGSGKTTLAALVVDKWRKIGLASEIIDGDALRAVLRGSVGFSKEDRRRHVLSAAFAAMLLNRNGVYVAAAFVSPYKSIRQEAREILGPSFVEVFVNCPLSICRTRDPKGLYKKAEQGILSGMTGVDDPYECPEKADLVLETGIQSIEESMERLDALMKTWRV